MSSQDRTTRAIEPARQSISALRVAVYVAVLMSLGATLAMTASAESQAEEPTVETVTNAVVVDLSGDGDAVVETTVPFDLSDGEEQTRFEAFVGNEQQQQTQRAAYGSRLRNIATDLEAQTGREMRVTDVEITTRTDDGQNLGVIVLSATWEGLASAEDSQLVLQQPFDSGFDTNRTVVVRPPSEHEVVTATPTPTEAATGLVWGDEESLDGFQVVVEPLSDSENDTTNRSDGSETTTDGDATGPGFGVVVALLAVGALGVGRASD